MSKNKSKKINADVRSKELKIFSVGSVILVLAIIVVVNIILSATVEDKLKIDLSPNDHNTISEQTESFIKDIPSDVSIKITGLFSKPEDLDGLFQYVIPLIDDLGEKSNGKITVEYVDPTTHPNISNELDPKGNLNLNDSYGKYVISCSNGNTRLIDPNDFFAYDDNFVVTSNLTEAFVVNTINSLIIDSSFKAYFLTDVGEGNHTYIERLLKTMNVEVASLPMTQSMVIPDDCSLLIINDPDIDINESAQEAIKDYIHRGTGVCNLLVSAGCDSNNVGIKYDHLNNVLHEMNLEIEDCYIEDTKPSNIYYAPSFIYWGDASQDYAGLTPSGKVLYSFARDIVPYGKGSTGVEIAPVVVSSEQTSLFNITETMEMLANGQEPETPEVSGPANVVMNSTFVGSRFPVNVYVFGSNFFLSDDYYLGSGVGPTDQNVIFIKKLLDTIVTTEGRVDIPEKPLLDYSIDKATVDQETITVMSITFLVAIPMVLVVIAVVVYHRRKHL